MPDKRADEPISPVFLYFDPHPVHEKMANAVGAEPVQCETDGVLPRILSANSHEFDNRPVIIEGGVPLVEGSITKLLGNCGPVIALGADSTYDDLVTPLAGRSRTSRTAHRISMFFVDGTLAVSERIATLAERFTNAPVRIVHPFVEADRFEKLRELTPDIHGNRILCVGKYRQKNRQGVLHEAMQHVSTDCELHFVGQDTELLPETNEITTHGFVSQSSLIELFDSSAIMAFPAAVGAFPVATLEALCAGLPVIATSRIGTATLIRGIHGRLVTDPDPESLAHKIDWYFSLPDHEKSTLAAKASNFGSGFTEPAGLETFQFEYHRLLDDIGYTATT